MINPLSFASLVILPHFNDTVLGTATGFILSYKENDYLVTNWHVITGRNPETGKPLDQATAAIPNSIYVWYHHQQEKNVHKWIGYKDNLFNQDGNKLWLEHEMGRQVDVAILPITLRQGANKMAYTLNLKDMELIINPSDPVSIIGFPMGKSSVGNFPIWKTGHVATEIDIDYDQKPIFLIDATTRAGMSGSPVVARRSGAYEKTTNNFQIGTATKLLGVYSGRKMFDDHSEIGLVWKPRVIEEIFQYNAI